MHIYLDTADIEEIREVASWGVLSGVTTNPSLMAKVSGKDFKETIQEIASLVEGPISAEVLSTNSQEMIKEGRQIAKWHENVVVKIPTTVEGLKAISTLALDGIATNATLVFSPTQALLVARAGATYVSPFIGRLDDNGQDGVEVVGQIVDILSGHSIQTAVLAASIRHVQHVIGSALVGADIATMPYGVLQQMITHPLTDIGLEKFLADWQKRG